MILCVSCVLCCAIFFSPAVEGSKWSVSAQIRARPQQSCHLPLLQQRQQSAAKWLLRPYHQVYLRAHTHTHFPHLFLWLGSFLPRTLCTEFEMLQGQSGSHWVLIRFSLWPAFRIPLSAGCVFI